jgi:ornithine--oxo-acid transaminase
MNLSERRRATSTSTVSRLTRSFLPPFPSFSDEKENLLFHGYDDSAVNQGHCHPHIIKALTEQAQKLTLSSRAFHTNSLGPFSKYLTEVRPPFPLSFLLSLTLFTATTTSSHQLTGFEMALMMNTGAEAVETAIKVARKWGYKVKGIPANEAIVLFAENNFHGRTVAIVSASTDPDATNDFGPFTPLIGPQGPGMGEAGRIPYNDVGAIERVLEKHGKNTAAIVLEPIQGEAGIVVPDEDYLEKVQALCKKHNVLLVCDEVQTVRPLSLLPFPPYLPFLRLFFRRTGSRPYRCPSLPPAQPGRQA